MHGLVRDAMKNLCKLVWLSLSLFASTAYAQNSARPSEKSPGVTYRCAEADGSIAYTSIATPGCVVLFLYTKETTKQPTQSVVAHPVTKSRQDERLIESGSYTSTSGDTVHRPAHTVSGEPPVGATAQCRDASYSFSESHRGTCSHHGGVERWL